MEIMTEAEWRAFIFEGTRTGKLATASADGRPHVVPIWFIADGDELIFTSGLYTKKNKNIDQNPNVTLCIDSEDFPYHFVMIEGQAKVCVLPPNELTPYAIEIARRYVPAGQAEAFGERNGVEGECLIRIKPTNIIAQKDLCG